MERAYREAKDIVFRARKTLANVRPAAITGQQLVSLGIFSAVNGEGKAQGLLQNDISITLNGTETEDPTLSLVYSSLSKEECTFLLGSDLSSDRSSGLVSIMVGIKNSESVLQEGIPFTFKGAIGHRLPITPIEAAETCHKGQSADITWRFYY